MIGGVPAADPRVWVLDDAGAVAREAAKRFAAAASRAVEASTHFRVALSGGRTPLAAYRLLGQDGTFRDSVHWPSVDFFWGDERFVGPDDPQSNYRSAQEALLGPLEIDPARIHPVPTEAVDASAAATAYEQLLGRAFGTQRPQVPRFDLVLLGLGADGHTASLFPGALPDFGERLVVASRRPDDGSARVTLTPTVLSAAREVLFLVTGAEKAEALEGTLRAKEPDPTFPASLVRPAGGMITWLADRAAAATIADPSGAVEGLG